MNEPIHTFHRPAARVYIIKPGWLGSGIADRNGREIFEGDIVRFGEHDLQGIIVFKDAMFQIKHGDKFTILGKCKDFIEVEVIGHIEEDES